MADCGNSVKRLNVTPERNGYKETLEWIVNFIETEILKGCPTRLRPSDTEWRVQRVHTILTLRDFKEKLDAAGVKPNSGTIEGSNAETESTASSLIRTVTSSLGGISSFAGENATTASLVATARSAVVTARSAVATARSAVSTKLGKLIDYTGTCIGGVLNTDHPISEKYLREVEAIVEEDQTLSRPLEDWLNISNELDANVQAIFGVSLTSSLFNIVIKVFEELCKSFNSVGSFVDQISFLKQGKYSLYIGKDIDIEKLKKFHQCLSSSEFSDRTGRALSALCLQPEEILVFVDGVRAYRTIVGISGSPVDQTLQGDLDPEVLNTEEVKVFPIFQTIKLTLTVVSLINAASIIRQGTSKYSEALKHLIRSLSWELECMENL